MSSDKKKDEVVVVKDTKAAHVAAATENHKEAAKESQTRTAAAADTKFGREQQTARESSLDVAQPPWTGAKQPEPDDSAEGMAARARRQDAADEAERRPKSTKLVAMDNGKTEPSSEAKELLIDACTRFGVDPTEQAEPRELKSWNYYPAEGNVPASVVIVTSGGMKLRHYADPTYLAPGCSEFAVDQDTEETLARIFRAYEKDPLTKGVRRTNLPGDMALPEPAVTGFPATMEHRYRRGYLAEGGKKEADRRDAAALAKKK